MLCRLADEFGFKIGTFQHGLEVYKVADIVQEHVVPGGGASIFADWWAYKVEVQDAIPYAGPMQTEVGVLTSYNSDSDEMARRMNVEAAKAAKYSHGKLSDADALKFVTINPAKQLQIDKQVGSIETGKDADIAIWSGPPLSSMSRCERTFVDGREMFSLEKDAEARKANQTERARIIQKILALKDKPDAPGRGKRGDDSDSPNPEGGKPTDDDTLASDATFATAGRHSLLLNTYRAAEDARREYFLDLLRHNLDPRFHAAGECGCAGN
jgi:N-acetylglucosamine-6-phosphate deacetylase